MRRISQANRNFVIAYILLVGLPLLGLVAVLKVGRQLSAPISLQGEWKLETQVVHPQSAPCGQLLAMFQDSIMGISQSGKGLVMSSSVCVTNVGRGGIEGTTLKGLIPLVTTATVGQDCGSRQAIVLVANLNLNAQEPHEMSGSLSLDGCSSCAALAFRATRQTAATREAH